MPNPLIIWEYIKSPSLPSKLLNLPTSEYPATSHLHVLVCFEERGLKHEFTPQNRKGNKVKQALIKHKMLDYLYEVKICHKSRYILPRQL